MWCSNDYLGMSQHPKVLDAMHRAVDEYGAGSGGSRNIGGTHAHYARLESSLADWHGKEAALVFPTGYGSNDATLQCLLRVLPDPYVVSDELNHASIINGIRSTKAAPPATLHYVRPRTNPHPHAATLEDALLTRAAPRSRQPARAGKAAA